MPGIMCYTMRGGGGGNVQFYLISGSGVFGFRGLFLDFLSDILGELGGNFRDISFTGVDTFSAVEMFLEEIGI